MPSPSDFTPTTINHARLLAPPRINLRRVPSYTSQDRFLGPLSSTSSRFSFNHLFFPPPSPSLPALLPRRKRSPSLIAPPRPSRVLRYLLFLTILATISYWLGCLIRSRDSTTAVWSRFDHDDVGFEMVGHDALPDFPTPIVTSHGRKGPRWAVYIPPQRDFPLTVNEYAGMGGRCREVSTHARELDGKSPLSDGADGTKYQRPDPYYLDVDEAEKAGLLPVAQGRRAKSTGSFVGLNWESVAGLPACQSTLTYVLESPDAGLGMVVMNMWMLYGLAQQQKRAFFLDDSRWAYGAYSDIFQPPPLPNCRPPPRRHMVPCPPQAKHLVVSSVTLKDVLPALMAEHHRTVGAKKPLGALLGLAQTGYKALFNLNKEDQDYVLARVMELRQRAGGAPIVGLHVRHGDRHPLEYQYQKTYLPHQVFLDKAQQLSEMNVNSTGGEPRPAVTIIASDDPMVSRQAEFAEALPAQERILLSLKKPAEGVEQDPRVLHHFKEEEFGWEGGFFASMFWGLGTGRRYHAEDDGKAPSELTLRLRSYVGRAYMMDLAVLAGVSDYVVCAVSAMGCRMLAVMMGWEAVEGGRWVNVDGDYGWGWMSL